MKNTRGVCADLTATTDVAGAVAVWEGGLLWGLGQHSSHAENRPVTLSAWHKGRGATRTPETPAVQCFLLSPLPMWLWAGPPEPPGPHLSHAVSLKWPRFLSVPWQPALAYSSHLVTASQ